MLILCFFFLQKIVAMVAIHTNEISDFDILCVLVEIGFKESVSAPRKSKSSWAVLESFDCIYFTVVLI